MQCRNCGKTFSSNDQFCGNCGTSNPMFISGQTATKMRSTQITPTQLAPGPTTQLPYPSGIRYPQPPPPNGNRVHKALLILVVLLVVAVLGLSAAVVSLLTRSSQTGNTSPNATVTTLQPKSTLQPTQGQTSTATVTPSPTATPEGPQTLFKAKFGDKNNWNVGGWKLAGNSIASDVNGDYTTSPTSYESPADFKLTIRMQIINSQDGCSPDFTLVARSSATSNGTALDLCPAEDAATYHLNLGQPFDLIVVYNGLNITVEFHQGAYSSTTTTTTADTGGAISITSHHCAMQISSFDIQSF